jgi:hypothetical protein
VYDCSEKTKKQLKYASTSWEKFFSAFAAVQVYVMLRNATRKRRPDIGYSSATSKPAVNCEFVRKTPVAAARGSPVLTGRRTPHLSTGKFSNCAVFCHGVELSSSCIIITWSCISYTLLFLKT